MAGKNTGDCEYGFPVYGGAYIGDMEYGSVPVIGETAGGAGLWVKISGVWTAVVSVWVKIAGNWVEANLSAKVGETWELIYEP